MKNKTWRIEATNFENETFTVLENFFGTYYEAQKKIDSMLNEIEQEHGFIATFEFIV